MKALTLLHGWGMTPAVFDALGARLDGRYALHAMALPGYDDSSCEPCELERLAQCVAAAAPERCFVAGWSLGGQVALAWARAAPQQVERMVVMATTPCFARRDDWDAAVEAGVLHEFAAGLERDTAATLRRFASLQARGGEGARRVATRLRACLADDDVTGKGALKRGLEALIANDLRPLLRDIAHDVLVMHGEKDTLVPLAAAEYLAHTLPRGRLAVVRGAAHAPFISDPEGVADAMVEFFR